MADQLRPAAAISSWTCPIRRDGLSDSHPSSPMSAFCHLENSSRALFLPVSWFESGMPATRLFDEALKCSERSKFLDEWLDRARDVLNRHPAGELDRSLARTALLDFYDLMVVDVPDEALSHYEEIDEGRLSIAALGAAKIMSGDARAGENTWEAAAQLIFEIAVRVRALDAFLNFEMGFPPGRPPRVSRFLHDGRAYILPRFIPRARLRDGQAFSRRALIHHRILPRLVRGVKVEPIILDDRNAKGRASGGLKYGAALVEGLSHVYANPRQGRFIVSTIVLPDADAILRRHVEAAFADGCFAVVWPELSVAPEGKAFIAHLLKSRISDRQGATVPSIVVAGSQHEEIDGHFQNIATIFDGYGMEIATHAKSRPYRDQAIGLEDIRSRPSIPVLVGESGAFAIAICKDFCDLARVPLYLDLDLDAVLVPSMGEDNTMANHLAAAQRIYVKYGTRTFVVQQNVPDAVGGGTGHIGYVLPPSRPTSEIQPADLRNSSTWSVHQAR